MAKVSSEYAVQMHGITKKFGSFYALEEMHLDVKRGSIHSLSGENGAGKSTMMNILYGLYKADAGEIYIHGKKAEIKNPNMAIELGIGMVHQHFMLVDDFTVTQNIMLGNEMTAGFGIVDTKRGREKILEIAEQYGLYVDPDARICDTSVGMQQRVEIIKALYRGAEILILDEPTAVLTPQETEELLSILKNLANDGKSMIIITHKLREIKASSDLCTVIRRGRYVDTVPVEKVTEQEIAALMVGRDVKLSVDKAPADPGDAVLEIQGLVVKNERKIPALKGLNLQVRKGEIVGIAGIDGNGQKELVFAMNGMLRAEAGSIRVNGKELVNTNVRTAILSGISMIPEDRQKYGMVMEFTVRENAVLKQYRMEPFSKKGILNNHKIDEFTEELIRRYDVRPEDCKDQRAGGLSGGNQQKVIIGREIAMDPELLIAVQPTRGLDVGAIEMVHRTLIGERDRGKAVLLISYELDEIMSLSDTIAVLYDGQIRGTFPQGTVDEQRIGLLMAGGKVNG